MWKKYYSTWESWCDTHKRCNICINLTGVDLTRRCNRIKTPIHQRTGMSCHNRWGTINSHSLLHGSIVATNLCKKWNHSDHSMEKYPSHAPFSIHDGINFPLTDSLSSLWFYMLLLITAMIIVVESSWHGRNSIIKMHNMGSREVFNVYISWYYSKIH